MFAVIMGWKHRRRRGQRGRFPKPVKLGRASTIDKLIPVPAGDAEPIYIEPAEVEECHLYGYQSEEAERQEDGEVELSRDDLSAHPCRPIK